MKIHDIVLMIFFPLVTSYLPCSQVFHRISAPEQGLVYTKLEASINHADANNFTFWRFEVTFNRPVYVDELNLTVGLQERKWIQPYTIDPLKISQEEKEKASNKKIFLISLNDDDFERFWWSISFSFFLKIKYESKFVDVSRFEVNHRNICTDLNRCGEILYDTLLIHHGNRVKKGNWPWLVALHNKSTTNLSFKCAGTLVSNKHVITAAHCLRAEDSTFYNFYELVVAIGADSTLDTNSESAKFHQVSDFIVHNEWGAKRYGKQDGDIAVLILEKTVIFTDKIRPACLDFDEMVGTLGTVPGWGATENDYFNPVIAREVKMPIVSNEECVQSDTRFQKLTSDRTICAGFRNGSGPCGGDSGGGFYTTKTLPGDVPRYSITGIVSRSLSYRNMPCDLSNYVIFTRIRSFKYWINYIIQTKQNTNVDEKFIQELFHEVSKLQLQVQEQKLSCKADLDKKINECRTRHEKEKNKLEAKINEDNIKYEQLLKEHEELIAKNSELVAKTFDLESQILKISIEKRNLESKKVEISLQLQSRVSENLVMETKLKQIEKCCPSCSANHKRDLQVMVDNYRISNNLRNNNTEIMALACKNGNPIIITALLDLGQDINTILNIHSDTCIHFSAIHNHINLAKVMLDRGADIELKDKGTYGGTPLLHAAWYGNFEVAKFFVEKGASLIARTRRYNMTALEWARKNKHQNIINLLVSKCVLE